MARLCRYLKRGHCRYGTKCRFRHEKVNLSCWHFFNVGKCKWGELCWFRHDTPPIICSPPNSVHTPIVAAVKKVVKAELQSGKKKSKAQKKRKDVNRAVAKLQKQLEATQTENQQLQTEIGLVKAKCQDLERQIGGLRVNKIGEDQVLEIDDRNKRTFRVFEKKIETQQKEIESLVEELREGLMEMRMNMGFVFKRHSKLEKKIDSVWHQHFYPFDRSDVGEEKTKGILKLVFPRDSAMTLAEKFKIVQKELGENFNHRDLRNLLKTDIQVGSLRVPEGELCDLSFVDFDHPHVQKMIDIAFPDPYNPFEYARKCMDQELLKGYLVGVMKEVWSELLPLHMLWGTAKSSSAYSPERLLKFLPELILYEKKYREGFGGP